MAKIVREFWAYDGKCNPNSEEFLQGILIETKADEDDCGGEAFEDFPKEPRRDWDFNSGGWAKFRMTLEHLETEAPVEPSNQ